MTSRRIVMAAAGIAVLLAITAPAWGHAKLLRATPAPGSSVAPAPAVVRLWFNDELDAKRSGLSVWNARGYRVDDGRGGVDLDDLDRTSMKAKLKPIGPGRYTVRWRAVSADDLFVSSGSFTFVVRPTSK